MGTVTFNDKLREWESYYDYHRPYGRETRLERLLEKLELIRCRGRGSLQCGFRTLGGAWSTPSSSYPPPTPSATRTKCRT